MSNKIDKFSSHITRLISIESYKVFLDLKVCILACLLKTEPWLNFQIFPDATTIYNNLAPFLKIKSQS